MDSAVQHEPEQVGRQVARERPVLFSAPMVRAILSGAKTQTRRLVKSAHGAFWDHRAWTPVVDAGRIVHWRSPGMVVGPGAPCPACPYGAPGDRLWVRETWGFTPDVSPDWKHTYSDHNRAFLLYRADVPADGVADERRLSRLGASRWRPSIHMPRWASRITLEVTEVRVQRLQEVSEDDARAEGVDPYEGPSGPANPDARGAFAEIWDRINGKRAPWASNPFVWAISFRRANAG